MYVMLTLGGAAIRCAWCLHRRDEDTDSRGSALKMTSVTQERLQGSQPCPSLILAASLPLGDIFPFEVIQAVVLYRQMFMSV